MFEFLLSPKWWIDTIISTLIIAIPTIIAVRVCISKSIDKIRNYYDELLKKNMD